MLLDRFITRNNVVWPLVICVAKTSKPALPCSLSQISSLLEITLSFLEKNLSYPQIATANLGFKTHS